MFKMSLKIISVLAMIAFVLFCLFLFNPITGGLGAYALIEEFRGMPSLFIVEDKSSTLEGIDENGDGIRDDVYNYAISNLKDDDVYGISLVAFYLKSFNELFSLKSMDDTKAREIIQNYYLMDSCVYDYVEFEDYYFKRKLSSLIFNTINRKKFYYDVFSKLYKVIKREDFISDFIDYGRRCKSIVGIDLFPIQFKIYRKSMKEKGQNFERINTNSYPDLIDRKLDIHDVSLVNAFYKELDRRYENGEFQDFKGW